MIGLLLINIMITLIDYGLSDDEQTFLGKAISFFFLLEVLHYCILYYGLNWRFAIHDTKEEALQKADSFSLVFQGLTGIFHSTFVIVWNICFFNEMGFLPCKLYFFELLFL